MNAISWLMEKSSRRHTRKILFILWALYGVSRAVYYVLGVRFDSSLVLGDSMSLVPYDLLQSSLLESVWHFHSQPPLFSLFCGIIVKLFGGWPTAVFHVVFILTGLILVGGLYTLMVSLGIPYRLAAILTALFSISPDTILYENIIFYTYPVAMMLVLSGLTLYRYVKTADRRWGLATFALWSLIILTRSMFHLVWFVAGVMIVLVLIPRLWKRTLMLALIPFLLAFGWYVNNYMMFGFFGSSSWMGMNLARITVNVLTPEERVALAREGEVSELVFLRPFPGFWQFSGNIDVPRADSTGVPILDLQHFRSGFSNYNHMVQLGLAGRFLEDSFTIIRKNPVRYVSRCLTNSYGLYFAPTNAFFFLFETETVYKNNYRLLEPFIRVWNAVWYGDFSSEVENSAWFILALYPLIIGYWLYRLMRSFRTMRKNAPFYSVIFFALMTVLYVTLIGNLFELGENMRFRYNVDPLMLTLFGLMLVDLLNGFNRSRNAP